jgi:uncharacterized damage-inducible protein DinB
MTYYGAKEIAASFRTVRKNTITIAEEIPEEQYGFCAAPGTRTVAQTLAHIAAAPGLTMQIHAVERRTNFEGFDFPSFLAKLQAEEQTPRTTQELIDLVRSEGERFAQWIETLDEGFLAERFIFAPGMTPPEKSRFEMLISAKEHEMHHRAQLMVIQRMIGATPHLTREMNARIAAMQAQSATA